MAYTLSGSIGLDHYRATLHTGQHRWHADEPVENGGQGSACGGPDCVVLKLYAITDVGGVVIVDVRRRDVLTLQ